MNTQQISPTLLLLSAAAVVRSHQPISAVGSDGDASCVTAARITCAVLADSECGLASEMGHDRGALDSCPQV